LSVISAHLFETFPISDLEVINEMFESRMLVANKLFCKRVQKRSEGNNMVINNQPNLVLLSQTTVEKGLESGIAKRSNCPSGPTYCLLTFFKCLKWCMMIPYKLEYCNQTASYQISMNKTIMVSLVFKANCF